jgi:hypothetical protein
VIPEMLQELKMERVSATMGSEYIRRSGSIAFRFVVTILTLEETQMVNVHVLMVLEDIKVWRTAQR